MILDIVVMTLAVVEWEEDAPPSRCQFACYSTTTSDGQRFGEKVCKAALDVAIICCLCEAFVGMVAENI